MRGYIYLGYDRSGYFIKIGKTNNTVRRVGEIMKMNPTFTIFNDYEVDNVDFVEKQLHKHFGEKRMMGEWFWLTATDLAYIHESLTGEQVSSEWIKTASICTGVDLR